MADDTPTDGGFFIILTSLRAGAQPSVAAAELARMFLLDPRVADQIIRKAPIIIFKGLTDEEVKAGKAHFVALSRFGMDFRVTQNPPVNVPKVNWPSRPDFGSVFASPPPAAPVQAAPAGHESTVQLLCPCCGSTLRMKVEAITPASGVPVSSDEAPGPAAEAVPEPVPEPVAEAAPEPLPGPVHEFVPEPEPEPVPDMAPEPEPIREPILEPEPVLEPDPVPEPVAAETLQPISGEKETGVALLVRETETDHPWCDGPYQAVPVDGQQEDAEFSAAGGGTALRSEPLFGPSPPPEPVAPVPVKVPDSAPEKDDDLVEVEPQDASGGIEEVEPVAEKVTSVEPGAQKEPPEVFDDDVTVAGDELKPWTGSARKYDHAQPKIVTPEKKSGPAPVEDPEVDDELKPWTGSARAYDRGEKKPEDKKKVKKADPVPDDGDAADLGMDQALVADVDEKDASEGFREGLEDLPELKPAKPPEDGAKPLQKLKKNKKGLKKKKKKAPAEEPAEPVAEAKPVKKLKKLKKAKSGPAGKKPAAQAADGGEYSVFLSKIVSSERKRKAVEILTEVKGIGEGEAEKLTNKMIIPVVKGVGKDEAEAILERFKKSKISGRITRKK